MTRHRRLLALVAAVTAALRLAGLGAESLWIDEIITVRFVAAYGPLELLTAIPRYQPHFPAYYVLLDVWRGLAGAGAATLRFPAAVAGTLAVPVAYLLASRLYDSTAGLLAAATIAVSRFHVADAQAVRMYAFVTLGVLASTYLFTRIDEGRRLVAAYLAATLCALSFHPFAVFLPLVHAAFLAVERATPASGGWIAPDTRWPVAVVSVPVLVAGAFGVTSFLGGARLTFVETPGVREVAVVLGSFLGQWPWPWNLLVGVGCGLLALLGLWRGRREPATRLLACWLAVPLAGLLAVSYLATPVLFDRYAVVAAPALPFLVVRGVVALGSLDVASLDVDARFATGHTVQFAVAGCLLLALASSGVALHTTTDKEEWDTAVETVEAQADTGALVVVSDCITRRAYTYYADRSDLTVVGSVGPESGTPYDRTPAAAFRPRMASHEEVWLVFSHVADREERRLQRLADERHEQQFTREFVGISVVGYEQPENETIAASDLPPTGCDVRIGQ